MTLSGYLSLGQQGSHLFFQVISQRHQQKSTVITTNLPFAEWGKVFDLTTVATAIADRLVHNSQVLILEGPAIAESSPNTSPGEQLKRRGSGHDRHGRQHHFLSFLQ